MLDVAEFLPSRISSFKKPKEYPNRTQQLNQSAGFLGMRDVES